MSDWAEGEVGTVVEEGVGNAEVDVGGFEARLWSLI